VHRVPTGHQDASEVRQAPTDISQGIEFFGGELPTTAVRIARFPAVIECRHHANRL
jgi:hypothetical protein